MSGNVFFSQGRVTRDQREAITGQRGCVVWLTGLSGSGKSTLARMLEERLIAMTRLAYVLDGDNLRHGLNSDLGFSPEDRAENIRRVGEVSALLSDVGAIVITAFISPYREDRRRARAAAEERFIEVWVKADLGVCESRDPKGLYKKARAGLITDFTGISAPYEEPERPEVVVDTASSSAKACTEVILRQLSERGYVPLLVR